jgi:hypothetical protein
MKEIKSSRKLDFNPYRVASHLYSLILVDLEALVAYDSIARDRQNQQLTATWALEHQTCSLVPIWCVTI